MFDTLLHDETFMWAAALGAGFLFVATLLVVPLILIRLPHDYFSDPEQRLGRARRRHVVLHAVAVLAKNLAGWVIVAMGMAMLVLPGQGILTIVVGLMLLDFPGKYRLELWVVRQPRVSRAINWIRRRAGRPPLDIAPH